MPPLRISKRFRQLIGDSDLDPSELIVPAASTHGDLVPVEYQWDLRTEKAYVGARDLLTTMCFRLSSPTDIGAPQSLIL